MSIFECFVSNVASGWVILKPNLFLFFKTLGLYKRPSLTHHYLSFNMENKHQSTDFTSKPFPIPRARVSASHESTLSTVIRPSGGSGNSGGASGAVGCNSDKTKKCCIIILKQQVKALKLQVSVLEDMVATLQQGNIAYKVENRTLHDLVVSLQTQLSVCQHESEKHRLASEQHRHEFWVFTKVFDNRKAAIAEEHQSQLKALQDQIDSLETESRLMSTQNLRYCQHNDQLCQLIHSLNLYVDEMEKGFSTALQSKTSELVLLREQHSNTLQTMQEQQAKLNVHSEELGIFKAGVHRAALFLAALDARA
jgi:hypothetical protein